MRQEEDIIRDAQNGVKEAFEEIVVRYQHKIYTLCYRYTGNPEDARDLAQEVFIKLYRNIGQFQGRSSFSTWLYQVAGNTCKDYLRKQQHQRQQTTSLEEEIFVNGESFTPEKLKDENTPETIYEEKERMTRLKQAIAGLSPEYRMVLVMREFQNLSYEEIARELDTSVGTVKSRLNRSRNALRSMFAERREGSIYENAQM